MQIGRALTALVGPTKPLKRGGAREKRRATSEPVQRLILVYEREIIVIRRPSLPLPAPLPAGPRLGCLSPALPRGRARLLSRLRDRENNRPLDSRRGV